MASLQVALFSGIVPEKSGGVAGDGCPRRVRYRWRVPMPVSVSSSRWRRRSFAVSCEARDGEGQSNKNGGEEPPESLFRKELKRRGMTPGSLLEDAKRGNDGSFDGLEEDRSSRRNAVSTEVDNSLSNQRQRSTALNSEGLEGLIPRAKLLLSIGGAFFLGFGPLILIIVAFFSALYLYFGSSFVHDASEVRLSMPQYIDPYELLEDERISQIASSERQSQLSFLAVGEAAPLLTMLTSQRNEPEGAIIVGPEGDFTEKESNILTVAGAASVRLGLHRLCVETSWRR